MITLPWLRCDHPQLSRLFTIGGVTYQVCLKCGAELEYDLVTMRLTGKSLSYSVKHLDEVHIARQQNSRRDSKRDQLAPERSTTR